MSDLKTMAEEAQIESEQPTLKYKIRAAVCVAAVLIAACWYSKMFF